MKILFSMERRYLVVRAVLIVVLAVVGTALFLAGKEMARMERTLKDARETISVSKPDDAAFLLLRESERSSLRLFTRLGLLRDDEFLRLHCAITLKTHDYEKAIETCSKALGRVRKEEMRRELRYNRAVTYIHMLGGTPKALMGSKEDLRELLRSEYHSRAAALFEKLNLFPKNKGEDPSESDPLTDDDETFGPSGGQGGGTGKKGY